MIEAIADNERFLREGHAALDRGDLATVGRLFHPGVIWHAQRLGQLGGDHVGWPAVAQFFGESMQLTRGTFAYLEEDRLGGAGAPNLFGDLTYLSFARDCRCTSISGQAGPDRRSLNAPA